MATLVTTKMSVLGPRPFGGTVIADLSDSILDRALEAGGTVFRVWNVFRNADGDFFSVTL